MTTSNQVALEQLMSELGRERYWARVHAKARGRRTTDTASGRYLLREAVAKMSDALEKWRKTSAKGHASRFAHTSLLLGDMKSGVAALIATRVLLDVATRRSGMTSTAFSVGSALEEELTFMQLKKAAPKLWRDLKKRMKARRDRKMRTKLRKSAQENACVPSVGWTKRDTIAIGSALTELAVQSTGLFEIASVAGKKGRRSNLVCCKLETLNWLEKSHEAHEALFPFYLPTFDLPVPWQNPYDGGYHTNLVLRRPLVKTNDKQTMGLVAGAVMPTVYRAVNAIQDTAWEVNPVVLEVARAVWESGVPIADIPERVDEPRPPRPLEPTPEQLKDWRVACARRHERVVASRSRRILHAKVMFMAEKFGERTFYFPHACDFRGRVYPIPFFLQPQGCSLARGLLRFAAPCTVETPEALEWFLVHGANCWGFDKVSMRERVEWVRAHHAQVMAVHNDPLDCKWWADADKPWEFLAWCLEYAESGINYQEVSMGPVYADWKPFESRIPIAMDGSNNGLQIYSLLLRDEQGAAATNCTPGEVPRDIYQDVADRVTQHLLASADPLAAKWIAFVRGRVPRAAVKRSVMTLPYGSTLHACIHYTRDWYEETAAKQGPGDFDRGYRPSAFLAKIIWQAIGETIQSATSCMQWLRDIADGLSKSGEFVRWTAPSGFPIRQEYTLYSRKQIKTTVGDTVRIVRYRKDIAVACPRVHRNGIAPNLVHGIDAAILAGSVCRALDEGVTQFAMVHDSYGVPAADAPVMARALREEYAETFQRDLLMEFKNEVQAYAPKGVVIPDPPERGGLDVNLVRQSRYFFA